LPSGSFGGFSQLPVLVNLLAEDRKTIYFDPELSPEMHAFGQHYGIAIFCRLRTYMRRHEG
jgi:hypothetical protein